MNCLKCGKEVEASQVFCADCQQVMALFPVEPGTPVHIPLRNAAPEKTARHKKAGYADSMRMLQKTIRWLCVALAVLTVIVCILSGLLIYTLNNYSTENTIGKNYTTVETNTP